MNTPVGLSDIRLHLPRARIRIEDLVARRIAEDPALERHMNRALASTGQTEMRYPEIWEDTVTLAAEAAARALEARPDLASRLRFLSLGTETSVDMSKPGSNYVMGALNRAGYALNPRLTSFQVQHACAGGTLALLGIAGFLKSAGRPDDAGLVLTSDIARYAAPSTAEVTQGAGATALVVETRPRLLDLDLASAGFFSADVDDFFRPLGSTIAKVKGGFSLACYTESFQAAFEDHCARLGRSPAEVIDEIDLWALHVPYSKMPLAAMEKLLKQVKGFDEAQVEAFLKDKDFYTGLEAASWVGNIYTGSLYLSLAYSLWRRAQRLGEGLIGQKVLLASYGSGNTMVILQGTVSPGALDVIRSWDFDSLRAGAEDPGFEHYQAWLDTVKTPDTYTSVLEGQAPRPGAFYLAALREDGYRDYRRA